MIGAIFFIDTFTLARLTPKETGLNCDIFLDSLGCERRNSKRPYILLQKKLGWKKIYTHNTSKALPYELRMWCENNKDVIERHYNKELNDVEALTILAANDKQEE